MISVVIPCHNAQPTLAETIRSALTQDVDKEVIVVDDGSTDRSADIIRSFGEKIRPLFTPNRGASAARDSGTHMARGQYVQYLDSDDLLAENTLAARLAALHEFGADVAFTDWQKLLPTATTYAVGDIVHANTAALVSDADIATATSQFWLPPAALLYRKEVVDRIGGWHAGLLVIQDARFLFEAARHGSRFVHVPGVGAYYRVRPDSLSRRDQSRFVADCARNADEIEALWRAGAPLSPQRRDALAGMWRHVAMSSLVNGYPEFETARARHNRLARRTMRFECGAALRRLVGPARTGFILRALLEAKRRMRATAAVPESGVGADTDTRPHRSSARAPQV